METPPSAGPLEICLEDKLAKFGQSPQNIEDHAKGPCVKSQSSPLDRIQGDYNREDPKFYVILLYYE